MRRNRGMPLGAVLVLAAGLAGCAGFDEGDLPPLEPVTVLERVPDAASVTGACLVQSQRVVTGRTFAGFAQTDFRPTGRIFCPAPGVVAYDAAVPAS